MKKKQKEAVIIDPLFVEAEVNANHFNLRCLSILCAFVLISEVLNEIGVFKVPLVAFRLITIVACLLFLIPFMIYVVNDKFLKKEKSILRVRIFKYIIVFCSYVGVAFICVTLSFHAVILLAIPPLISAQYRNQKHMFFWVMIAASLLVPIGVYGSFFFGTIDRNFIKGMISEEEFAVLANRIAIATPQRMLELFMHYAIPRLFGMGAIVLLVYGTAKRNGDLLEKQSELNNQVKQEIEQINKMQRHMINVLTTLIETRDIGTGEHVIRTKQYVRIIAEALQKEEKYKDYLTDDMIKKIANAAPLHDVGKIVVSDTILLKPGKLTPEEFEAMKIHTTKGKKVIEDIFKGMESDVFLHTAEDIAMYHHEKWDGTGYPQGLKGEEIPLSARIMAVADVYDALVSVRVYKKSMLPEEALDIMMSESGTHFDPEIMKVVERIKDEMEKVSKLPLEEIDK